MRTAPSRLLTFPEISELLIDRLTLESIQRKEGCCADSLFLHVLNTIHAGLLVLHDNRIHVATENNGHSQVVAWVFRLRELGNCTMNAREQPLQGIQRLPKLFRLIGFLKCERYSWPVLTSRSALASCRD